MIRQDYPDLPDESEDENAQPEDNKAPEDKENGSEEVKPTASEVFFTDCGHNFSSAPDGDERHDTLSLADSDEEFDSAEIKKAWDKATGGSQETADSPVLEKPQTENPKSKNLEEESKPKFEVAIGGPCWASGQKGDKDGDKAADTNLDIATSDKGTDDQTQPESTGEEKSKPKFQVAIGGPWWASGQKDKQNGDNDTDTCGPTCGNNSFS